LLLNIAVPIQGLPLGFLRMAASLDFVARIARLLRMTFWTALPRMSDAFSASSSLVALSCCALRRTREPMADASSACRELAIPARQAVVSSLASNRFLWRTGESSGPCRPAAARHVGVPHSPPVDLRLGKGDS